MGRGNGWFYSIPAIRSAGTPGPSCLPHVAHRRPQGRHLTLPLLGAHLSPHAMTGEHPIHLRRGYKVHRVGQGCPREKGLFRKDVELAPAMIPVQCVAGKQKSVVYVVQDVAFGMPWRRDRHHTGRYVGCTLIAGQILRIGRCVRIGSPIQTRAPYRPAQRSASATSSQWLRSTWVMPPRASML